MIMFIVGLICGIMMSVGLVLLCNGKWSERFCALVCVPIFPIGCVAYYYRKWIKKDAKRLTPPSKMWKTLMTAIAHNR